MHDRIKSRINLTGKRFGRIVITKCFGRIGRLIYWEYVCDCGQVKKSDTGTLNANRIQSCGCLLKEVTGAKNRKTFGESAKNRLLSVYKKGARRRNYEWKLSDEQFSKLIRSNCYYCGICPQNTTEKISPHSFGHIVFNGIDRVDNNKGYFLENCVTCCRNCNLAKHCFSYKEFEQWIKRICEFYNAKNCNDIGYASIA